MMISNQQLRESSKGSLKSRRGTVLIFVVAVLIMTGILAASVISVNMATTETLMVSTPAVRAGFLAESGLDRARAWYCGNGATWDGPQSIQLLSGESISLSLSNDGTRLISNAIAQPGTRMEARAELSAALPTCDDPDPGPSPYDSFALYVGGGNISIPSNASIEGSVYAQGIQVGSGSTVSGDVISDGDVTVSSNAEVGGSVCAATGDVVVQSSATVGENIHGFGDVTLRNDSNVVGSIYASGSMSMPNPGRASVGGSVHLGGGLTAFRGNIAGDVFTGSDVSVRQATTIDGDVHAGDDLIFGPGAANTINGLSWAGGARNDDRPSFVFQATPPRIDPTEPVACGAPPPPNMQTYSAGGSDVIIPANTTVAVDPGTYQDLDIGSGGTAVLRAGTCDAPGQSGCYVFSSLGPVRSNQRLRLDLSTGSTIAVFFTGNIRFSGPVEVSTDGVNFTQIETLYTNDNDLARDLAERVYWETHGSFSITTNNSTRQWFGTVLSEDDISLPSNIFAIGAFASVDGDITLGSSPTLIFTLADFARENW